MSNCSEIIQDVIGAECGKNATVGLEDDLILINFDDIDKPGSTVTNNVISELVLNGTKKGFKFSTIGRSMNEAGVPSVNRGTYKNTVIHSLPLRIFVKNEKVKDFVNKFIEGARVGAVVKNREIGEAGEVKYEFYGFDNGLEITTLVATTAMTDGIVYDITISSVDGAEEGSLPKSIFDTDLATTEAMLASLTA